MNFRGNVFTRSVNDAELHRADLVGW